MLPPLCCLPYTCSGWAKGRSRPLLPDGNNRYCFMKKGGKIFLYGVENVVKDRTGEEGYDALRDAE